MRKRRKVLNLHLIVEGRHPPVAGPGAGSEEGAWGGVVLSASPVLMEPGL